MITLLTNTANQVVRLTLDEGRQYYSTAFTHYLIALTHEENSTSGISLYQVASVMNETQRLTTIETTTIGLELAGRYRYEVYGQTSPTNIDPENASVVGLVERGWFFLVDSTQYYTIPDITISDDIIFNG